MQITWFEGLWFSERIHCNTSVAAFGCDKMVAMYEIAHGEHITNPGSGNCSIFEEGSDESYVLATCNVTAPDTWVRGDKVCV